MKISSFRYIVPQALKSIRSSGRITIAAVATITIALFLCTFFWMVLKNIDLNATIIEEDVCVVAYLDSTINTEVERNAIESQIRATGGVDTVTFISKEEGIESVSERFGDIDLDETLGGNNPLPDSYSITALSTDYIPSIAAACEQIDGISVVRYGEGTVEKLFTVTGTLREAGLVIMLMLAVAAVTLISMSVRLTIVARRKEIMIMKWVGATNSFIRWPFFLEGLILGVTGGLLALICVLACYAGSLDYITNTIPFISVLSFNEIWLPATLFTLGAGLLLGAIGSLLPMTRSLNV